MKYWAVGLVGATFIIMAFILTPDMRCVLPAETAVETETEVEPVIIVREKMRIMGAEIPVKAEMGCDRSAERRCGEQETGEEESAAESEAIQETASPSVDVVRSNDTETVANENVMETETNALVTTVQTQPVTEEPTQPVTEAPTDPHDILMSYLTAAGIAFWYPYACAQIEQESHWNPWAENPNGLDKGLLQYRITYWTEPESIFDVNAQIRKYVGQVAARIAAGLSVEEIISRHYTSDYVTEVNWEYVNHVLRWMQ